ncbi:Serpin family [Parasponia andersonii]|uniref:Serpin family n=1 Tax=Parasponia andersonii TaxID=3476 RepID=A0A2P5AVP0_PARAD|nr:Serpin family [Parasponia andersonii]
MEHSSNSNSDHFNTNFCLALANQVLETEATEGSNFVASPFIITCCVNVDDLRLLSSYITSLISVHDGSENPGPLLSFVNGAWLVQKYNLKPSFEATVKGGYKAEIRNADFVNKADEAVDEVNSWAERETKGLISELLLYGSINHRTALVFANTLYFKGSRDKKFDASKTQNREFHLLNGQIVQAAFMTADTRFERYLYRCFDGFKVLKVPYQSGQDPRKFSMYFFLPDEKDGLFNLIQNVKLNPNLLNQQFELIKYKLTDFWISKFNFSFKFEARETMEKMVLELPFRGGELTEVVDCPSLGKDLFVSSLFHKSFIEVNEEGTEVAATTAVMFEMQQLRYYPSFVADHPFLLRLEKRLMGWFSSSELKKKNRKLASEESSAESNPISNFNTDLCLLLSNQILLNEAEKGSNSVASPLSLHVMLSLVAAGSKGIQFCGLSFVITCYVKLDCCRVKRPYFGTTTVLSEVKKCCDLISLTSQIIRVASPDEGSGNHLNCGPQLKFVNGAWLDQRFMLKPSFETTIKDS